MHLKNYERKCQKAFFESPKQMVIIYKTNTVVADYININKTTFLFSFNR